MAGDKKIEQSEAVDAGLKTDICTPMIEKEAYHRQVWQGSKDESLWAARKDGIIPSDTTMSLTYAGDATSTVESETSQLSVADQEYNGSYNQLNDNGDLNAGGGSYTATQSDMPGYNPYGIDRKPPNFSSSEYLQNSISYGTTAIYGRGKTALGSNVSGNLKGFNNPTKTNNTLGSRSSNLPLNMKARQFTASPNYSKSPVRTQPIRPLDKLRSGYQSAVAVKGFQQFGKFSSYTGRNQGGYFSHDTPMSHRPNARMWSGDDRFDLRETSVGHGKFEAMTELTRGPRDQSKSNTLNSSAEDKQMWFSRRRDQYNLEDFQTEYGNAKFFVIKSYSEDDIHKCIKYDVWSSTPNGNKKLDAAFHNTDGKTSEAGTECPIFLFYSVNGSGQFVGLAEMVGPVDFGKSMDFWQRDKWNGFFPVKWHIVKDIPNSQLRHIILENNENKPVTHSRDTQEIGLQEGLQMLKIFKSYLGKSSMLDDFTFYENREQSLKAKRRNKPAPQTEIYKTYNVPKHQNAGERITKGGSYTTNNLSDPSSSLVRLTKNLSLNSTPLKGSAVMNRRE